MMFLDELARWLAAQELVTLGTATTPGDVYANSVPAAPDALVALFATGGRAPDDTFSSGNDRPTVQVRVRASNMAASEARAWQLYRALHGLSGVTFEGGTRVVDTQAIQSPTWLQTDANRRHEYVFNVQFTLVGNRPHLEE